MHKGLISENIHIHRYTTMGVGGTVKYYAEPESVEELSYLLKWSLDKDIPYFVLGGGSDVIFADREFSLLVINTKNFRYFEFEDTGVSTGAGMNLNKLIRECAMQGLSGLENLYGIPGTIGGAISKNAGAYGVEIKDSVKSAKILEDEGNLKTLTRDELGLSYRESAFEGVLVEVSFTLQEGNPDEIQDKMIDIIKKRNLTQPRGKTSGCIFKNPEPELSAGYLLDKAGLKGFRIGGAMFSDIHANFIVNTGNAAADDIFNLIDEGKRRVYEKFGIKLEEEVVIIK